MLVQMGKWVGKWQWPTLLLAQQLFVVPSENIRANVMGDWT